MKTYKNGISLIVLVITVIILAILATTVIITLSNTNIIEQANNTIKATNVKNKMDIANLYLADYYLAKHKGTLVPANKTAKEYITEQFAANNQDMSGIYVTEDGQIKEGYELPSGVELADEVLYEESQAKGYSGKWRVLGMDDAGRVLLVSEFIDTGDSEISNGYGTPIEAYNNIITTINAAGAALADGTKVISGRSINIDDINKITGFKPATYVDNNSMRQYNNKVTYTLTSGGVSATWTNGKTATTAGTTQIIPVGEAASIALNRTYTATSTYYSYYPADLGMTEGSDVWNMLFEIPLTTPYNERIFYIADKYIETQDDRIHWGIRIYYDNHMADNVTDADKAERITGETFWKSNSGGNPNYLDIVNLKLVVTVSPDYKLEDTNSDGIWDIVQK